MTTTWVIHYLRRLFLVTVSKVHAATLKLCPGREEACLQVLGVSVDLGPFMVVGTSIMTEKHHVILHVSQTAILVLQDSFLGRDGGRERRE